MRAMGIIRRLDELGRVVIPVEMRRMLDLADRDTVEIAVDGDRIVLQKHTPPLRVLQPRRRAGRISQPAHMCVVHARAERHGRRNKGRAAAHGGLNRSVSPLAAPKRRKSNEGYPGLFLPGRHRHADPA